MSAILGHRAMAKLPQESRPAGESQIWSGGNDVETFQP
jgi:hypothetical protein